MKASKNAIRLVAILTLAVLVPSMSNRSGQAENIPKTILLAATQEDPAP